VIPITRDLGSGTLPDAGLYLLRYSHSMDIISAIVTSSLVVVTELHTVYFYSHVQTPFGTYVVITTVMDRQSSSHCVPLLLSIHASPPLFAYPIALALAALLLDFHHSTGIQVRGKARGNARQPHSTVLPYSSINITLPSPPHPSSLPVNLWRKTTANE
jgi:hypothetical protein